MAVFLVSGTCVLCFPDSCAVFQWWLHYDNVSVMAVLCFSDGSVVFQ